MIPKYFFEISCSNGFSVRENPVIDGTGFPILDELEKYLCKQYKDKYIDVGEFRHPNSMYCSFGFDKNITISINIKKSVFTKHREKIFEYIKNYLKKEGIKYTETDDCFIIGILNIDKYSKYRRIFLNKIFRDLENSDTRSERPRKAPCFKGVINQNKLNEYAKIFFKEFITFIKQDQSIVNFLINFDQNNISEMKKCVKSILEQYSKKYKIKIDFKYVSFNKELPNNKDSLGFAYNSQQSEEMIGFAYSNTKKENLPEIWLNSDHKFTLDQFLGTIAHEINHILDHNLKGFLNEEQLKILNLTTGLYITPSEDESRVFYEANITEQVSNKISDLFYAKTSKNLLKTIKSFRQR